MADATNRETSRQEVRFEYTAEFPRILDHLGVALLISTYQAGKLAVVGVHQGRLTFAFHGFERVMGVAVGDRRIAVGTRRQVYFLHPAPDLAPSIEPPGSHDACWLTRTSLVTGNIHGHELAWGTDGLWVVNTLFSSLCTLDESYSFVPRWRPPFVRELAAQDRCHLNGLAMHDGRPKYVTAHGESDEPAGWRPGKATGGCVIDVPSGETVARGLAMPHSPRVHDGRLWVLDSGTGSLVLVDPATGRRETVESLPGYARGLAFVGQFAFVGLSKIRETAVFGGLPIAARHAELRCGVAAIDLVSGRVVASLQFHSGVEEIFAVAVLPGARNPVISGPDPEADGRPDVWVVPKAGQVPDVGRAAAPRHATPASPVTPIGSDPGPVGVEALAREAEALRRHGRLWVLDSGTGRLVLVEPSSGRWEAVESLPGFARGLAFVGEFAFVGLS
ncbi:MAG TPA: TIGR03032 family protein, partial [Isosphaeraceae bacterium]